MNRLNLSDFTEAVDPAALFELWLEEAIGAEINDPEAMALSTVDERGLPDARMVLCKGADARGVVFYTNVESAKGRELAGQPVAAALFHWKSLRRQVRFRGLVAELTASESDAYFASRPRGSQIGAWASQQSRPLASRAVLEAAVEACLRRFGDGAIPRPGLLAGLSPDAGRDRVLARRAFPAPRPGAVQAGDRRSAVGAAAALPVTRVGRPWLGDVL